MGDIQKENSSNDALDFELLSTDGPLLRGFLLHVNQWHAMFKKRFFCWKRSWITNLLQNLIPVALIVMIVLFTEPSTDYIQTNTVISLNQHGKTVTMLQKPTSFEIPLIEK